MTDLWTDKLSDFLDGELPASEREALELHLSGCSTCRETLDELRAVTMSAKGLPNDPPARDLWPGIAAAIGSPAEERVTVMRPRWRREFRFALPQLLAASVALMLLSGGAVWWALQHSPVGSTNVAVKSGPSSSGPIAQQQRIVPQEPGAELAPAPESGSGNVASRPFAGNSARLVSSDSPRYDRTIAELQQVLSEGRGTLDSSTVRILEQNLAIIDQAVEQARRAVAADPANPYLRSHLAATMKRKADLLRKATVLASAEGQG